MKSLVKSLSLILFVVYALSFTFTSFSCGEGLPKDDITPTDSSDSTRAPLLKEVRENNQWTATFRRDAQGHVIAIDWDNGDTYSFNVVNNLVKAINLLNNTTINFEWNTTGSVAQMTSCEESTDFIKRRREFEYVNTDTDLPNRFCMITENKDQNGNWSEDTSFIVKDMSYTANGALTSCTITTYNANLPFQEYECATSLEGSDNPFFGDAAYFAIQEFIDGVYDLSKLSKKCLSKITVKDKNSGAEQSVDITHTWNSNTPKSLTNITYSNGARDMNRDVVFE